MSEAAALSTNPLQSYRRGLFAATAGCAMISTVLLLAALVLLFKPQFGHLVGPWFLPGMSVMVLGGGLAMLWGAWKLRGRRGWEWIALFAWGAVALTSPAFGIMFMLPLGVLVVFLPVVIVALVLLWRDVLSA
jgi:4-hydroxybenzoate polyprenyltransferase